MQTPNTPETRALAWVKAKHPDLYKVILTKRPDLIREAYARPLNGLGEIGGWTDDLLNLAKQAIPIYQQQKVFSAQLKQATAAPTPQAATYVPAAPVNMAPVVEARNRFTLASLGTLPIVAGAGVALYFVWDMLSKKKRRR
jgi:hypothetical protein